MSTHVPARIQPGTPAGGRFAVDPRAEASIDLSVPTGASIVEDYPDAVPAALDDMADDVRGASAPYRFADDVEPAVRAQVSAFIAEHADAIEEEISDSDDGGWMLGRDIALARNNPAGTPHYRLAFGWMKDPDRAQALREAGTALGPMRLAAAPDGTLHLTSTVPLPPSQSRTAAAADPFTDSHVLDRIARVDHRDPAYRHWDKVAVAANPAAARATIDHIVATESEPEFALAIAERTDASTSDLAWASASYDLRVRTAVLEHPNTSAATVQALARRVDAELETATAELARSGVSPMRAHEQWLVDQLTGLKSLSDRRAGA